MQHIMRVLFKYVSGVGSLITSQKYHPLLTMIVMSQKLWFERDVIPKVLVSILAEDGNDDEITDESHSVDDYDKDENEEYNDY